MAVRYRAGYLYIGQHWGIDIPADDRPHVLDTKKQAIEFAKAHGRRTSHVVAVSTGLSSGWCVGNFLGDKYILLNRQGKVLKFDFEWNTTEPNR